MRIVGRLTVFADDSGPEPSADAEWMRTWLEQHGATVRVEDYSTGGYEHIWNVEGPESALQEVPEHLRCASQWSGTFTPREQAKVSLDDAHAIVAALLERLEPPDPTDCWVVIPEKTVHFGGGWIVYFTSKLYVQTHDPRHAVAGNAPYLVDWISGEAVATGTAQPIELYIKEFQSRDPRASTQHLWSRPSKRFALSVRLTSNAKRPMKSLICPHCKGELSIEETLRSGEFSWPEMNAFWLVCPKCREGSKLRVQDGKLGLLANVRPMEPNWDEVQTIIVPGLTVRADPSFIHVWLDGAHFEFPARV